MDGCVLLGSCVGFSDHLGQVTLCEPLGDLEHLLVRHEALEDSANCHAKYFVEHFGSEVTDEADEKGRDPDVVHKSFKLVGHGHVSEKRSRGHDEELAYDKNEARGERGRTGGKEGGEREMLVNSVRLNKERRTEGWSEATAEGRPPL